jgi:hypothetical protein
LTWLGSSKTCAGSFEGRLVSSGGRENVSLSCAILSTLLQNLALRSLWFNLAKAFSRGRKAKCGRNGVRKGGKLAAKGNGTRWFKDLASRLVDLVTDKFSVP